MTTGEVRYGSIIFWTLFVLLSGFSVMVGMDPYTNKRNKRIFDIIIILEFVLVIQNLAEFYVAEYHSVPDAARIALAVVGYSVRPAIIAFFAELFAPRIKHIIAWCLVAFNALLHTTAFFTNFVFTIKNNSYAGGPLNFWCLLTSGILIAYLAHLIVHKYRNKQPREIIFHAFWMIVIIGGALGDIFINDGDQWVDFITISIVISTVLSYIWFHQHFVREYELNVMEEQRMRLILSQVQPHFIYNALSSIRSIEGNPEETKRAITEFANYIRFNLSALNGKELIPFRAEMEFVKDYVSLQERRFPGRFKVIYDIHDEDLSLPPLTIQILVENSIHHGIVSRYEPGTIVIHTHCVKDCHVITVSDDGVGFDVSTLKKSDRVGLSAVKNRLEYYLDGVVDIASTIGKGTVVTLYIPCGSVKKDNMIATEEAQQ